MSLMNIAERLKSMNVERVVSVWFELGSVKLEFEGVRVEMFALFFMLVSGNLMFDWKSCRQRLFRTS